MTVGIPTMYRGVRFRSRLEAKWAVFFDLAGWPWMYEPVDLNGYVPDFILQLHQPVLVEVKPALNLADMSEAIAKIGRCGWNKNNEALVVGASIGVIAGELDINMWPVLGLLTEGHGGNPAQIVECRAGHLSFIDSVESWHCRVCGEYDGDAILMSYVGCRVDAMWAHASNHVQWRGMVDAQDVRRSR